LLRPRGRRKFSVKTTPFKDHPDVAQQLGAEKHWELNPRCVEAPATSAEVSRYAGIYKRAAREGREVVWLAMAGGKYIGTFPSERLAAQARYEHIEWLRGASPKPPPPAAPQSAALAPAASSACGSAAAAAPADAAAAGGCEAGASVWDLRSSSTKFTAKHGPYRGIFCDARVRKTTWIAAYNNKRVGSFMSQEKAAQARFEFAQRLGSAIAAVSPPSLSTSTSSPSSSSRSPAERWIPRTRVLVKSRGTATPKRDLVGDRAGAGASNGCDVCRASAAAAAAAAAVSTELCVSPGAPLALSLAPVGEPVAAGVAAAARDGAKRRHGHARRKRRRIWKLSEISVDRLLQEVKRRCTQ